MNTPIDTLFAVEYMKKQIDGCYKQVKLDLGKWYNIRIVVDTTSGFEARIYLDGALVATSQNFYGSHTSGSSPSASRDFVNIRVQRRVKYEAYIDNVVVSFAE